MPDATLDDFNELVVAVMTAQHPILPQPHWGQDCAFLAFIIDRMVEREIKHELTVADREFLGEGLAQLVEFDDWGSRNEDIDEMIERLKNW